MKSISPKALKQVLHYFSFFNHALSAEEVRQYLSVPATQQEVTEGLKVLVQEGLIYCQNGWFALAPDALVLRAKYERLNLRRLKLAHSIGRFIAVFPFVRGVYLSGSLSKMGIQSKDDDLDFFILTRSGRVWTTKFFLIAFKKIFLLNSEKYFCINLLMDENQLSLAKRKRYTATEVASLITLRNDHGREKVLSMNDWVKNYFPNVEVPGAVENRVQTLSVFERILNATLGDAFERWCKARFTIHMRTHTNKEEGYFESETYSSAYYPHSVEQRLMKHLEEFENE